MSKRCLIFTIFLMAMVGNASASEKRCGWFDNPTPANAWLVDKDGEWIIAVQMGYQAEGEWPQFKEGEQILSGNTSYGYGCACLEVETDIKQKRILKIIKTETKPISLCKNDKSLTHKKNLYDGMQHEFKDSDPKLKQL